MDSYRLHMNSPIPEDLYVDPPLAAQVSATHQVRHELYEKYGVCDAEAFLVLYMEHACSRTVEQVVAGDMLLPPGTIDRKQAYKEFRDCVDTLSSYSQVCVAKRADIQTLGLRISNSGGTLRDKEELGFKTTEYVAMSLKACRARRRLWEISGLKPIDGAQFHKDMMWYQRVFISDRFAQSGYADLSVISL